MRITNNMKLNMALSNVTSQNERLTLLEQQLSSGKKITKPSDDPLGAANSIKLSIKKTSISVYNTNLTYTKSNLSDSDTSFSDVGTILTRFKELSVRGSNGTLTQGDRDIIANEMELLMEQVLSDANLKNTEGYLFSGSKIKTESFSATKGVGRTVTVNNKTLTLSNIINVNYNGDRSIINRNESENSQIRANIDGESAFMSVTRQSAYSIKTFSKPDASPLANNLKNGYFTIKGRDGEELIKIEANDSLQNVADKINNSSKIAAAHIVEDKGSYRIMIEAREKGSQNQFALIEGSTNKDYAATNFLELAGLNSKISTVNKADDPSSKLSFQMKNVKNGYFYLNDVMVSVDISKDSLNDVVNKINESVRNVNATIEDGRIAIEGAGSISLDKDTTGIFEKLGLPSSRLKSSALMPSSMTAPAPLSYNEWVKNGNFTINGQNIGILDASKETIYSLRDKINATGINATASIEGDRFVVSAGAPPSAASILSGISDGTSEFLKSFEFSYQSADINALSPGITADTKVTAALGLTANSEFEINGKRFKVTSEDTFRSLSEKINSENLGVTASFTSGRFELSPNGTRESLSMSNIKDVNGGNFLTKIAMGNRMASSASLTGQHVSQSLSGAGITGSAFSVNGVTINYDPATDNLSSIASRINEKVANVHATINSNNELVFDSTSEIITADDASTNSNFLERMSMKSEKIVDNNNRVKTEGYSENAQSLFDILIDIRDKLYSGNINGLATSEPADGSSVVSYKSALEKLDEAIAHIADMREVTGSGLAQVERSTKRNSQIENYLDQLITENDGVDYEKAVVEYNTVDLIYKSSLQIGAKVNQQSLLDFIN